MTLYVATITLILVMDPFGNTPYFLSALKDISPRRRIIVIIREMCIALVILSTFLFFGKYILRGMQISESALSISGGIILFFIAIKMVFVKTHLKASINVLMSTSATDEQSKSEPFVVPLAMPLIAGPGAMAMVVLFTTKDPDNTIKYFYALLAAWVCTSSILLLSELLRKILDVKLITGLEKLMGMILTTLAVQMLLNGITLYIKSSL